MTDNPFPRGGDDLAARARSVLLTSSDIGIGEPGRRWPLRRHLLTVDGGILASASGAAGECVVHLLKGYASPTLRLWAADVAGTAQPDRLRGAVRAHGTVTLVDASLVDADVARWLDLPDEDDHVVAFVPDVLHYRPYDPGRGWGAPVPVPLEAYRAARPDALAGWERGWLEHLADAHAEQLRQLAAGQAPLGDGDVVRPLRADESGLMLRIYRAQGAARDVHVPFPVRVECGHEAVAAVQHLLSSPSAALPTQE